MKQDKVWDSIAPQWYNFRHWPFPEIVKELSEKWKPGKILDIGCGNCRNLMPFAKRGFECYGIDFSEEMIDHSKKYCKKHKLKINLKVADAKKIPFKDNYFDYCLFLASLNCIEEEREKALLESKRVLKKDGLALITVWNKLKKEFWFKPKDIYLKWGEHERYYHLFTPWELNRLLKQVGFKVLGKNIFGKNLIFIVKK